MIPFIKRTAALVLALGSTVAMAETRINGAGATFPEPLYQKLVVSYQESHPEIKIDYKGIGSGGGIKGITDKTIHFAGSDAPLSAKEIAALGGADAIVQFPTCAGGVVPIFNLDGVTELNFTGEVLADIYMGKITKWNDAKIAEINEGVTLPDLAITPAWRTDGSGTTFVFTNYLATQSKEFDETIGASKLVSWKFGQGGKGNPGVAQIVKTTKGGIGYVEQAYAVQSHLTFGAVKNKDGKYVKCTPEAVSAAGEGALSQLNGTVLKANLWNQSGESTYPIASFTYIIVYKDLNNLDSKEQAQALVDFLKWATHDGQSHAPALDFAPLAPGVQEKAAEAIKAITYKGEALN